MLDGSFWRLFLIALLVAPTVVAAPPAPLLSEGAVSAGGQDIMDLAMDASGRYAVAVVQVDPAKLITGLPGQTPRHDIYACDFGDPGTQSTGTVASCRTIDRQVDISSTTTSLGQTVAATSFVGQGGLNMRYVVGGPSDYVSFWSANEATPRWEHNVSTGNNVVNVSITPDAKRIIATVAPPGTGNSGRVLVFDADRMGSVPASQRAPEWSWPIADARPTAMVAPRAGGFVAVGTTNGVLFFQPTATRAPDTAGETTPVNTGTPVRHLAAAADGSAVVAAAGETLVFIPMNGTKPFDQRWSVGFTVPTTRVAVSGDGQRFAAAAGSKIYFYERVHTGIVAARVGEPYDTGNPVADLAYDAKGQLLVAVAGTRVYGFGPSDNSPMWTFDATESSRGNLDGPLRQVEVSEGADRIVVAGKTRVMPYRNLISATASFTQASVQVLPGTTTQFQFTLTNTGSLPDNYSFVPHFPVGWNGRAPDSVSLLPDRTATLNVSLDIPPNQAPGIYGFDVQVRSQALLDRAASSVAVAGPALNFTIPRAIVLNVTTAEDRVPPLRAGGEQVVPVTVRNRGNAEGVVNLSVQQAVSRGSSWNVRFQQDQVRIPGGGEMTLNLIIAAPQEAASGDRNDITIIAREGPTGAVVSEATRVITAYVDPKFGAELSARNATLEFLPGELIAIPVTILNTGNTEDTFNITTAITPDAVKNDWGVTLERSAITIPRGQSREFTVSVRPGVSDPRDASLVVRAVSNGSAESESAALTLGLVSRLPATTPDDRLLPAPPLAALVAALALAALVARRGGRAR